MRRATDQREQTAASGFHGRRHGRRLRPHRRSLLVDLLPKIRIDPAVVASCADLRTLFERPVTEIWLEVGFGAGEQLADQAEAHPDIGFIGSEPYVNGVAALLSQIDRRSLDNVRIFDDDARPLMAALPEAAVGRVFVLFPDPWPKKRHRRRRLVGPGTVELLARLLRDQGQLCFASDDMNYVCWSLDWVTRHPAFRWTATGPADWRRRPADWFETRYEAKARAQGIACAYLTFTRVPRREETCIPRCTDNDL